jgi:hypothetical protein
MVLHRENSRDVAHISGIGERANEHIESIVSMPFWTEKKIETTSRDKFLEPDDPKALCTLVLNQLQATNIYRVFGLLDRDGNGTITREDYFGLSGDGLKPYGYESASFKEVKQVWDTLATMDSVEAEGMKDGQVTAEEFVAAIKSTALSKMAYRPSSLPVAGGHDDDPLSPSKKRSAAGGGSSSTATIVTVYDYFKALNADLNKQIAYVLRRLLAALVIFSPETKQMAAVFYGRVQRIAAHSSKPALAVVWDKLCELFDSNGDGKVEAGEFKDRLARAALEHHGGQPLHKSTVYTIYAKVLDPPPAYDLDAFNVDVNAVCRQFLQSLDEQLTAAKAPK